jgi:hypothetical protein
MLVGLGPDRQSSTSCFVVLTQAPDIGKPYRRHSSVPSLRRVLLRATRYHMYYVTRPDAVGVLAVWHSHRGQSAPALKETDRSNSENTHLRRRSKVFRQRGEQVYQENAKLEAQFFMRADTAFRAAALMVLAPIAFTDPGLVEEIAPLEYFSIYAGAAATIEGSTVSTIQSALDGTLTYCALQSDTGNYYDSMRLLKPVEPCES